MHKQAQKRSVVGVLQREREESRREPRHKQVLRLGEQVRVLKEKGAGMGGKRKGGNVGQRWD